MINIIILIDYIFSNNYEDFLSTLRPYLYNKIKDNDIIKTYDNIIWYYMFNDFELAKKDAIKIVKYINKHLN